MVIFRKLKLWTQVPKIDHNSACGHSFLLKLSPLYSTQKGLSIYTKKKHNTDEKSQMVPFHIAGHICKLSMPLSIGKWMVVNTYNVREVYQPMYII